MTPVLESTPPGAASAPAGGGRSALARLADRTGLSPQQHPLRLPLLLVLLPLLAGVGQLIVSMVRGSPYAPFGDQVYIELHVRDIGSHAVLTGPYSRFGWAHPGPAMYYLLAPLYWLTGTSSQSLAITPLLVNAACVVGIALIVRRRAGTAAALWTLAVLAIYLRVLGPDVLRDNWNPHLPVLPCALMAFLCWSLAAGNAWALPGIAALATLQVQSHAGFAMPVLACLAVPAIAGLATGIVTVARRDRRTRSKRSGRRWLLASAVTLVVIAVMWLPPVIDAITHDGGNLRALLHYFQTAQPDGTFRDGVSWVNSDIGALPAYVTGIHRTAVPAKTPALPAWTGAIALAALAISVVLAARRRSRDTAVLAGLAAALCLAGIAGVERIVGPLFDYLAAWVMVAGIVLWSTLGVALLGRSPQQRRAAPGIGAPRFARSGLLAAWIAAVVALAGVAVVATPDEARATTPWTYTDAVTRSLSRQVVRWVGPQRSDLLRIDYRGQGDDLGSIIDAGNRASALFLALDRSGLQPRVSSYFVGAYGAHWGVSPARMRWDLLVVQGSRPGSAGQLVARAGGWFVYATPGPGR